MKAPKLDLESQIQQFSIAKINEVIALYKPPFARKLVYNVLYYILIATSILPQYFNLFKFVGFSYQNSMEYNIKLIIYSLVVSFTPLAKKALKYNKNLDPLNEYRFYAVITFLYYASLVYPLLIIWDLYDQFTPLKVVLLMY